MDDKKALVFKKLDSIMYPVKDLKEGIKFFEQFGFKLDQLKEDIGWCNLHLADGSQCIDLSTDVPASTHGDPYYLVDSVKEFYQGCLEAGIKIIEGPAEGLSGDYMIIEGPGAIKLGVLDLTKLDQ